MSEFDATFDFVVVGSGGGSMCAGLVMRSLGKSVLILEKTDLVGGSTARSGGVMWIPNNQFMKRDGIEDSFESAMTYLDNVVGDHDEDPGASRERRTTYVTEAPRMVDFLVGQGIKLTRTPHYPDYYDNRPGGNVPGRTVIPQLFNKNELGPWRNKLRSGILQLPAMMYEALELPRFKTSWHARKIMLKVGFRLMKAKLTGKKWVTCGEALQGRMLQAALKNGVEIRTNAPVSGLITEDGAVTGVMTEHDGKPWRIGARLGVMVNAGGFARNQEMRDKYQPGGSSQWSATAPGDTGEMIEEMARQGAAIAQMDAMIGIPSTLPPGWEKMVDKPSAMHTVAHPHAILVDRTGVRYMNEAGSYMEFCQTMVRRNRTIPTMPSWCVCDSQQLKKYMIAGTMPGTKKPKEWYDKGYLKRADTIEELAVQMGVDPGTLRNTVDRFNGFVDNGYDEDFQRGERSYDHWLGDPDNKPNPNLGKIEQAPFYAFEVVPGDVGTYGGVVTDVHARVLREDGSIIPGLYATGVSTASVMGHTYPGAGASVGPSFTWGFVAAKHAANADNLAS